MELSNMEQKGSNFLRGVLLNDETWGGRNYREEASGTLLVHKGGLIFGESHFKKHARVPFCNHVTSFKSREICQF